MADRVDDREGDKAIMGKVVSGLLDFDIRDEGGDLARRGGSAQAECPCYRGPQPRIAGADKSEDRSMHEIH
jgi:hypothetical protein